MGGRAKLMKRTKRIISAKNVTETEKHVAKKHVADIGILPRELIVEVLALVAASSFTDFFNAKLSCKVFNEVSEEDYIYEHVSLERFPVIPWRKISEEAASFLERCKECGNPESLYRQGLIDFFKNNKLDSGLHYLEKAANKGHNGARYVLGIVLLFSEDHESKATGIRIISGLKKSRSTRKQVKRHRKKFRAFIKETWERNDILFVKKPTVCSLTHHYHANAWDAHSRYLHQECDACQCDLELALVDVARSGF